MEKLVILSSEKGSWIENDTLGLSDFYEVEFLYFKSFVDYVRATILVLRSDSVMFWFIGIRSTPLIIIASLLRKKNLGIVGGFETVSLPEIGHGLAKKSQFYRWLIRLNLNLVKGVAFVSKDSFMRSLQNFPEIESKSSVIHLGFTPADKKFIQTFDSRKKQVLFIGSINDSRHRVKGFNFIVDLAKKLPKDFKIVVIGRVEGRALLEIEENGLNYEGFLEPNSDQFKRTLGESLYVVQTSAYESFGAGIVEAAIYGAFPIAFNSYALSEVLSPCSYLVEAGDTEAIANFIKQGKRFDPSEVSEIYLREYSIRKRCDRLIAKIAQ